MVKDTEENGLFSKLTSFKGATKFVLLTFKAEELLAILQAPEKAGEKDLTSLWRPEYASYMVEGTPGLLYP